MIPPRPPPEELELDLDALHHARTAPSRAEHGFLPSAPPPRNGGRVVLGLALGLLLIGGGVVAALLLASSHITRLLAPTRERPAIPAALEAAAADKGKGRVVYAPTLAPTAPPGGIAPGTREETPMLFVDSVPAGATVVADGLELGVTPLAVETPYPEGESFSLEVTLRGRAPWRANLAGGRSHTLSAQLVGK